MDRESETAASFVPVRNRGEMHCSRLRITFHQKKAAKKEGPALTIGSYRSQNNLCPNFFLQVHACNIFLSVLTEKVQTLMN